MNYNVENETVKMYVVLYYKYEYNSEYEKVLVLEPDFIQCEDKSEARKCEEVLNKIGFVVTVIEIKKSIAVAKEAKD